MRGAGTVGAERPPGGGGGGALGRRRPGGGGAEGTGRPSSVFWRAIDVGGGVGARDPGGGGMLGTDDMGRDFFAASPSKMSRSELALSLIGFALYCNPFGKRPLARTPLRFQLA